MDERAEHIETYSSYLNWLYFGGELVEVTFDDDWSQVANGDVMHQRHTLTDVSFDDTGVFHAKHTYTRHVPDETARAELQAVIDTWRSRGWDRFADAITDRTESNEDDSWQVNVLDDLTNEETVTDIIEIKNPVFTRYERNTINPKGLTMPITCARITNLTFEGISGTD